MGSKVCSSHLKERTIFLGEQFPMRLADVNLEIELFLGGERTVGRRAFVLGAKLVGNGNARMMSLEMTRDQPRVGH